MEPNRINPTGVGVATDGIAPLAATASHWLLARCTAFSLGSRGRQGSDRTVSVTADWAVCMHVSVRVSTHNKCMSHETTIGWFLPPTHTTTCLRVIGTMMSLGVPPSLGSLPHVPTFSMASDGLALLAAAATQSLPIPSISAGPNDPTLISTCRAVAIPPKLVKKILDLDFVEMGDLLPEAWGVEASQSCCPGSRRQTRRAPVTDILLWVECFSVLVSVLASKHPERVPDFMAYQKSIVKASRNFEGTAWVVYDRCYRRQAAATKSLAWGTPDSALYNEAFTGRARAIPRCNHCLSENHGVTQCPDIPLEPSGGARGLYIPDPSPRTGSSDEYCQLFNQVRCRSRRCKYQHLCNLCSLPHPAQACPTRTRGERVRFNPMAARRGRELLRVPLA